MTSCLATGSSPTRARVTTAGFRAKRSASAGRRKSSVDERQPLVAAGARQCHERFHITAFDVPILQLQLKADRGRHRLDPLALGLLRPLPLIENQPDARCEDGHSRPQPD